MSEMQNGIIVISKEDNVAVALEPLKADNTYAVGDGVKLLDNVPFAHKVALMDIAQGQDVIKYGYPIGCATRLIKKGEHVHVHNMQTKLDGLLEYTYTEKSKSDIEKHSEAYFDGYVRPDGRVGTRNEVWIIPTVGCVNNTAKRLEEQARRIFGGRVDDICAYTHNNGCSQLGKDHFTTQTLLKGLINHPNAGGVLVLSLGCENNDLEHFLPVLGAFDPNRMKFLVTQDVDDEYEAGIELLGELVNYASTSQREKVSAKELCIGFKCGSSDAFSGITANVLCGHINDHMVACGGSTILTEVPEMFGAETILMERAIDRGVFERTVGLINGFKSYFTRYGQSIYENPSPGNKKGGITTLEEKSLGCTQKGGHAPVVDVLDYGEQAVKNGLHLLNGSGNDPISCTNMVSSGAQLILFTTGRGNPFGSPVPTIKISSNTILYERKPHWIDFDAGQVLRENSFEQTEEALFQYILDVASGRKLTRSEENGYKEISIFRDGVIL